MLQKSVRIKDVFSAFESGINTLTKSYSQYDDVIKQDVLFDFTFEFMQELQYFVAEDDMTDLLEDYYQYENKAK